MYKQWCLWIHLEEPRFINNPYRPNSNLYGHNDLKGVGGGTITD